MRISSSQGGTATVRNVGTGETGSSVRGTIDDTFMFIGVPDYGYHKTYVKLKGKDNEIAYDSNYVVNTGGTYEYTGYFAPNSYTVSISIESGEYQSYYQGGTYAYGTALEMWVEINPHYVFHYWEDTNGNRVYPEDKGDNRLVGKITVTGDVSYKLVASPRVYTISVSANPADGGTVTGGGEYTAGTEVTISATANEGYAFSSWSDGVTSASRKITLNSDVTLTANFDKVVYTCTYYKGSSTGGTVPAPQTYHYDDYVTIRDKGSLTHDDVISSSSYTISFNANGGSTTKTSESCSITKTSKYSFSG